MATLHDNKQEKNISEKTISIISSVDDDEKK